MVDKSSYGAHTGSAKHPSIKEDTGKIMIRIINSSVFWINNFPVSNDVGRELSPTTIITGCIIDFALNCKLDFG